MYIFLLLRNRPYNDLPVLISTKYSLSFLMLCPFYGNTKVRYFKFKGVLKVTNIVCFSTVPYGKVYYRGRKNLSMHQFAFSREYCLQHCRIES